MPKDNENMPLLDIGPLTPSESQAFAPEQMIQCEKCKRSNAPTRVNCLYCGSPFAFNDKTAAFQKPALRPLEKWEQGYSNILLPVHSGETRTVSENNLAEAATLLKLAHTDLHRILESQLPLPLARAAGRDEALLVERRLKSFGIRTLIVSDADLRIEELPPLRIRAAELDEEGMWGLQSGGGDSVHLCWSDLRLLVHGRLLVKSTEVQEKKITGRESQILDATETYNDELVVDLYHRTFDTSLRITANSFDFSCLADRKGLLAYENFRNLLQVITERAPNALVDDSFKKVRQALEPVWPSEKQTDSRGWRRSLHGKYTLGAVTDVSNETQFTRYSRLRNHFYTNQHLYETN